MELKNLKDFYEKQEYYSYDDAKTAEQKELARRFAELSFFVNIGVFSVLLAVLTYVLTALLPAILGIPAAFVLTFLVFISVKKGIGRVLKVLVK